MRRVVVAGGTGFFGSAAVELLKDLSPVVASRRTGLDVENKESIRKTLKPGDVVLDAAGPFQDRSTALIECAIEMKFDVVDISDSLAYALSVQALEPKMGAIRVLTSCSSVSALSASFVRLSGIDPVRVTAFLIPATKHSANSGSARSMLQSIGAPIKVLRKGRLETRHGWTEEGSILLPPPFTETFKGHLFETADAVNLPRVWPKLQWVDCFIDTRVPGLNGLLAFAATSPVAHWIVSAFQRPGTAISRLLGSARGCYGVDIEGEAGAHERHLIVGEEKSYLAAVAPAVMAAGAIARNEFEGKGLIAADRQVEPIKLLDYLKSLGISHVRPA